MHTASSLKSEKLRYKNSEPSLHPTGPSYSQMLNSQDPVNIRKKQGASLCSKPGSTRYHVTTFNSSVSTLKTDSYSK